MLSSCDTQIYNMYRSNMAGITLCRLLLAWVFIFAYPSASQDCCMFNQWEGSVYFGSGAMEQQTEQSDVTRLSFTNGSGMISYDLTNSRSYLLFESYTTSSDSTIVRRSGAMLISDYNMVHTQYAWFTAYHGINNSNKSFSQKFTILFYEML